MGDVKGSKKSNVPKRVLVLLATHNGIQWIKEQLDSIRSQEGVEVSVLASDDASIDGTFEYLKSVSYVTLLEGRGPHGSAGKNFYNLLLCADFSEYDFVSFSDQDDIWYPCKLARAIDCLENRCCDGYSANVMAFWENGREKVVDKAQSQRKWDFLFQSAGPGCTYVMSTMLAKAIQRVLRTNPRVAKEISLHDWFVYAWARANGLSWFIDKKIFMLYRQHSANEFGVNTSLRTFKKRIEKAKSGWYRAQVTEIAMACGVDSEKFVQKILSKTWRGRMSLVLNAGKLRRRYRDAVVLTFISIMGWF